MLSVKFIVVLLTAHVAVANLGDLNSIFSAPHSASKTSRQSLPQSCGERSSESYERHTVINNLDKALEIGLNATFHDRFECMQRMFDDKLAEMQHFYKMKLKESKSGNKTAEPVPTATHKHGKKGKSKSHKKSKQSSEQAAAARSNLVGQTGFVYYSLNQNGTVTDFKHESFRFVQPVQAAGGSVNNQTAHAGDVLLLEGEIEAFNSDMFVLKSIMASIKRNMKARVSLLKAIKSNERELESETRQAEEARLRSKRLPREIVSQSADKVKEESVKKPAADKLKKVKKIKKKSSKVVNKKSKKSKKTSRQVKKSD